MENPVTDYIGLIALVFGVGGAVWFFWSRIKAKAQKKADDFRDKHL